MMYSAFVKDKETGEKKFIESDYPTRSNFLNDLKANGYTVYRAEPKEVYDYILRNTNGSKTDWEIAKKLYKEGKPLTKEEYDKMKDEGYEVVNDKSIDAIKDNFTPPGAEEEVKEDIEDDYNPQSEVRYTSPEELKLSEMSEEDLKQGIEDIKRGVTDYTDAEEPVVTGWIKDELAKRKSKPKDEMADFQKSLDDYVAKNKKGRDDIPVTTRR